ncbi:hypothetical protein Q9L58_010686 [Maublancomyces gigas]|uniref:Uncharacterized protein n=1 Tax=Discina gigas TaxID=1032678 RepID=A0ABR3G3N1_9PEZI
MDNYGFWPGEDIDFEHRNSMAYVYTGVGYTDVGYTNSQPISDTTAYDIPMLVQPIGYTTAYMYTGVGYTDPTPPFLWAEPTQAFVETGHELMEFSNNCDRKAEEDAPRDARVFNSLDRSEVPEEQIATDTTKKRKAKEDAPKASTTSKKLRFQQPDSPDPTIQSLNRLELPAEPMAKKRKAEEDTSKASTPSKKTAPQEDSSKKDWRWPPPLSECCTRAVMHLVFALVFIPVFVLVLVSVLVLVLVSAPSSSPSSSSSSSRSSSWSSSPPPSSPPSPILGLTVAWDFERRCFFYAQLSEAMKVDEEGAKCLIRQGYNVEQFDLKSPMRAIAEAEGMGTIQPAATNFPIRRIRRIRTPPRELWRSARGRGHSGDGPTAGSLFLSISS